jgi:hypothetical protein
MTAAAKTTIYVELLGEGTDCWRPVEAEHLGADLYRITGETPEDEVWSFSTGDTVKCKTQAFQTNGSGLVASEKIS